MAAWREEDHPRDARGRFARKGSSSAVSIKRTLANLAGASDDDILDVFSRVSGRSRLSKLSRDQLAALDQELARREGSQLVEDVDDTPEQRQIDQLVARGWSYAEAYGDVYGDDKAAAQGRAQVVDVDRRKGETREQALRRQYQETTYLAMLQAESWTRGNLLNAAGRAKGIAPAALFSGNRTHARKYASEELARFWQEVTPRQTYQEFRASRVGDSRDKARAQASALAGSGKDFSL